jgi:hypothetical protein
LWWGVSVCVYGEEWEAADSSEEEEEIGLPPCSKVLARTAYRPVVPLALAIACMRRTTSSARIQGRTGERELVSTATTALLRGPPPGRTAPFIVSSDGDQIHLILDRSGSEGKKAPPVRRAPALVQSATGATLLRPPRAKNKRKGTKEPNRFQAPEACARSGFCLWLLPCDAASQALSIVVSVCPPAAASWRQPTPPGCGLTGREAKPATFRCGHVPPHGGCIIIKKR